MQNAFITDLNAANTLLDPILQASASKSQQPDSTSQPSSSVNAITCFTPGTNISTIKGLVPVQSLSVGDRVLTRDRGFQPIRWIGKRHIACVISLDDPNALPVLIRADALGPGRPERDIIVSPRHRILTTDRALLSGMGETEALIDANALVGRPGIMRVLPNSLTYIHVLLDQHEVILSDNLWSESFHLGRPAAAALLKEQQDVIRDLFPQIDENPAISPQALARLCLTRDHLIDRCA